MSGLEKVEELLRNKEKDILESWIKAQLENISTMRRDLISNTDLRAESINFLREFTIAIKLGVTDDVTGPEYDKIREFLINISRSRALLGFTPSETATFVFSLKESILPYIQEEYKGDVDELLRVINGVSNLLDKLGLLSFEEYSKGREEVIKEQIESLIELSLPVMKLWDDILAVPIIGVLDSKRAKIITENLLNMIVEFGAKYAIIDITGVPMIDSQVANHLFKTIQAVRLLGADAVITGIRPDVAQTLVELGIDLGEVVTSAVLAGGLEHVFKKLGYTIEIKR